MDLSLSDETLGVQRLVRQLVERYAMPLEAKFLRGETITDEERDEMTAAAKEQGLWGLDLPEEYGGAALSTIDNVVITEENSRCLITIPFGGRAGFLLNSNDEQKEQYLMPTLRGEKRSFFAQTEPSGGSGPGNRMETTAVRD
ncbi:MAG TPA: acyl-CoA dehydrogenase family protein, partial [Acidobacteriota bacterium]|nr:acyl-CoA dehydrogenase family protein [Acidobacteriota bacterium]